MRVLAVDTSTGRGSVAVAVEGRVRGDVRLEAPDGHSRHLLPAVAFLLERLALAPSAIDAYAVTIGPGTLTGLRVGLSTVQGLALAAGRPCLGVSTLDVLAARAAGQASRIVALMDGYRGEVFGALYDGEGRPLGPPEVATPADFLGRVPAGAAFIGEGADLYRAEIQSRCAGAVFPTCSLFLAGTLARLAEPRLRAGEGIPPGALRPLYLREAHTRRTPA